MVPRSFSTFPKLKLGEKGRVLGSPCLPVPSETVPTWPCSLFNVNLWPLQAYICTQHTHMAEREAGREGGRERGREGDKEGKREEKTDFLTLLLQEAPREFFFYPYSTIQVSEATAVTSPNPLTAS